jgi:hypothetical protein
MLFFQPVVVHDASAADRTPPAEVRVAEERAPEQEVWSGWTGMVLAQSSLDNRSPFGANAVDRNDVTPPAPAPHNPTDTVMPPSSGAAPGTATPADSASNTRIPPPAPTQTAGQPDAGPPPPVTTPTPGPAPERTGAGNAGGTTSAPSPTYAPSSSTFPGAREGTLPGGSSGASNSR